MFLLSADGVGVWGFLGTQLVGYRSFGRKEKNAGTPRTLTVQSVGWLVDAIYADHSLESDMQHTTTIYMFTYM
jgi:hypothetical protein